MMRLSGDHCRQTETGYRETSDSTTETVEARARAGSHVAELLGRSLALSRAHVLSRVARYRRALQADGDRRGLGAVAPGGNDAGVHCLPRAGWDPAGGGGGR